MIKAIGIGAIVGPILAQARFVDGPLSTDSGYFDLGDGNSISLVAITDEAGANSKSWNVKGELFPEPLMHRGFVGIRQKPAFDGPLKRTLLFRTEIQGDVLMKVTVDPDQEPQTPFSAGYERDLGGGVLLGLKVALPDQAATDLHIYAPNSDWKVFASAKMSSRYPDLRKVPVRVDMKNGIRFQLSPTNFSDDEILVEVIKKSGRERLVLPRQANGNQLVNLRDPSDIEDVVFMKRTVKHVVFKNVSLYPKANQYAQAPSIRDITEAKGNVATLKSGHHLELESICTLSGPDSVWSIDGKPLQIPVNRVRNEFDGMIRQHTDWDPAYRFVALRFQLEDVDDFPVDNFYDEFGRRLNMNAGSVSFYPARAEGTSFFKLWPTREKTDLLVPTYAADPIVVTKQPLPVKIVDVRRNGDSEKVIVTFLKTPFQAYKDKDFRRSIQFLDINQHPISNISYSGSLEEGELRMTSHKGPPVKPAYITAKLTPCEWVRFKDVHLKPK